MIVATGTLDETAEDTAKHAPNGASHPGLVVVFSSGAPTLLPVEIGPAGLVLGREWLSRSGIRDAWSSKEHVRVTIRDGQVFAQDLGSRNGTVSDGQTLHLQSPPVAVTKVLRFGKTVAIAVPDVAPFRQGAVRVDAESVIGPKLAVAFAQVDALATVSSSLFVSGESGSGKELAARRFHRASRSAQAPFVAINCANVPEALAERLLFGARKGVYSGAHEDSDGCFQAAHGGTLFLDEVAELALPVQAKLLRVLETKEVLPLGAAKARSVDVKVVAASLTGLDEASASGRFRRDLYYRIGQPAVMLPPLRERLEELPWFIARVLRSEGFQHPVSAKFVESCLLRPWPGNVREFTTALKQAVQLAKAATEAELVLDATVGQALKSAAGVAPSTPMTALDDTEPNDDRPKHSASSTPHSKELLEQTLAIHHGNISAAARALGLHRTQFRRLAVKYGIGSK